jgi:hypothetical protein
MEKKKISPRIEGQSQNFLSKNFNTLNAGAEYVLDGFPMLYNRALHEMRGHFSDAELSFLVEAFKDTKLSPQLAGQQFKIFCDDAMTFRKLDDKWKIKSDVFLKKVEDLTSPYILSNGLSRNLGKKILVFQMDKRGQKFERICKTVNVILTN